MKGHVVQLASSLQDHDVQLAGSLQDHDVQLASSLNWLDHINGECPADVVDRVLWRNAQSILQRHAMPVDGICHACGRRSPCSPRRLAERAAAAARRPWHEAWTARNDMTGIMPMLKSEFAGAHNWRRRNQRGFDL